MGKKGFGIACLAGAAVLGYALGQRGYLTVPQDEVGKVPEKKAKEIRLNYDEKLLHNIDSLRDSGLSAQKAIRDGHTITWEEAQKTMPKKTTDYSPEDWVKLEEAQNQIEASRTVAVGRMTIISYHEDYPEELSKHIAAEKKELQKLNNREQTKQLSSATYER